jgi:hypothetical protein
MKINNKMFTMLSLLVLGSIILVACGGTVTEAPTEAPAMPEVGFAYAPGGALEAAVNGEYSGTTVTVDGAFEGNDADGVKFSESMKAFEDAVCVSRGEQLTCRGNDASGAVRGASR